MGHTAEILVPIFPLSKETLCDLQDDMMARLDQFVYRFTRLQDSMARRLLASMAGLKAMRSRNSLATQCGEAHVDDEVAEKLELVVCRSREDHTEVAHAFLQA